MLDRLKRARTVAVLVALVIVIASWLPAFQDMATHVVDAGLKQALITYGSLRALNGFISVIQGTEVSAGPIFGQATLAIGQILSPVQTLLEQVSTVMLWATVSFGIQKALLVLCGNAIVSSLVTIAVISWAALHWFGRSLPWLNRVMLIMFLVRFVFPVSAIGTHVVFDNLFTRDLKSAEQSISMAGSEVETSWRDLLNPKGAIDRAKKVAETLPKVIVQVVTSFVVQTVLLPLFMLWALVFIARGLFKPSRDQVIVAAT
jgi:hypothetical protein